MHIVRTIVWVLLLVALGVFSVVNWEPVVTVRIWPGLLLDTKIPVIVVASFLIGFVPLWLYLRGVKWQLGRRIQGLERSIPVPAPTPAPAPVPAEISVPSIEAGTPELQAPPV